MRVLFLIAFVLLSTPSFAESIRATYYNSGHRTANGERFNPHGMTAAHRTLPFGTRVRVSNALGRSIIVRINDRGVGFGKIDLAQGAAKALGILSVGNAKVNMKVIKNGNNK